MNDYFVIPVLKIHDNPHIFFDITCLIGAAS